MRRYSLFLPLFLVVSVSLYSQGIGNTVRYSATGTATVGDRADFLYEWGGGGIVSASGTVPFSFAASCAKEYGNLPTMYSQPFEITPSAQAVVLDMSYRLAIDPGKKQSHGGLLVILIELVDAVSEERLGKLAIEYKSVDAGIGCNYSSLQHLRIDCDPTWFAAGNRTVKLRAVLDVVPDVQHAATIEEYTGRTAAEIK